MSSNTRLAAGAHVVRVALDEPWPLARPGQFAMLSVDDERFPLLPRPFSLLGCVAREGGVDVEFLIMPVGRGSGMLCARAVGEPVQVVGPFGHSLLEGLPSEGRIVCVGGGYGIAPFIFLGEALVRAADARRDDLEIVFGARTAARLDLADRAADACARLELCTDDGSRGFAGRVDARLAARLDEAPASLVLTCGPEPMMEAVGRVCAARSVPARASLETVMGCGYAVCNGCAVAVDDDGEADGYTYHLACREGTVFDADRLHWERL